MDGGDWDEVVTREETGTSFEFEFVAVDGWGRLEFFPSFVDRFVKGGDCGVPLSSLSMTSLFVACI